MRERVAIPLFGEEVAPRFRFATRLLLADLVDGTLAEQRTLFVGELGWRARLAMLARERVTLVICGGFHCRYLPFVQGQGIRVSWGHAGPVAALLDKACRGEIESVAMQDVPAEPRRGRGGGCGLGGGAGRSGGRRGPGRGSRGRGGRPDGRGRRQT